MRNSVSPGFGRTTFRLCAAALLASVATGCSSDVSRFGGLFGSDAITTSSIPRQPVTGGGQMPRGDVGNGGYAAESQPVRQTYPQEGAVSYRPVETAVNGNSGTRLATTPMSVERNELVAPSRVERAAARETALAQPLPEHKPRMVDADTLTTGTVAKPKAGWSADKGPVVMLRQGESVKTLSNRYGVPEKEILAANGLARASDAEPGQKIVIPTFSTTGSAAKAATDSTIASEGRIPVPERRSEDKVAVLPGSSGRDKEKAKENLKTKVEADNVAAAGKAAEAEAARKAAEARRKAGGAVYEVQPGDSLARIAGKTGVSVDALKKANGLETASIRIGQELTIPAGGKVAETRTEKVAEKATDKTVTASVPARSQRREAEEKKPESYKAPVRTVSVSEATETSDVTDTAPESTGIGKYRWPVRGQVVAGYGANVNGSRNDGIDISVPEGTPIKAAENGVVIYSGSSLKELGNAVLVRHDDGTVTVYGHAGELNVQRGQKIQRGQTLASSGMSGNAKQPKLHFEVRKDSTAVNPMSYLE